MRRSASRRGRSGGGHALGEFLVGQLGRQREMERPQLAVRGQAGERGMELALLAQRRALHVADTSRLGRGDVSLTLGLQNSQGQDNVVAMSSEAYNNFSGVDIYENAIPGDEMEYVNPGSRQNRINSSQLVHDFVA